MPKHQHRSQAFQDLMYTPSEDNKTKEKIVLISGNKDKNHQTGCRDDKIEINFERRQALISR